MADLLSFWPLCSNDDQNVRKAGDQSNYLRIVFELILKLLFFRTKKDIFPTRLFGSVEKLDDLITSSATEHVEEESGM